MNRFFAFQGYTDSTPEINFPKVEEPISEQEEEVFEKIKAASSIDEVAKIMGDALADTIIKQIKDV